MLRPLLKQLGKATVTFYFLIHVFYANHQGFEPNAQHVKQWRPYLSAFNQSVYNSTGFNLPLHGTHTPVYLVLVLTLVQALGAVCLAMPNGALTRLGSATLSFYVLFEALVGYSFWIWPSNSASSIFDKTHFFKNLALAGSLLALSSDAPKVRRR